MLWYGSTLPVSRQLNNPSHVAHSRAPTHCRASVSKQQSAPIISLFYLFISQGRCHRTPTSFLKKARPKTFVFWRWNHGYPKTNAMRILEKEKISYEMHTYDASDGHIDGAAVARKVGMDPAKVFKTLVTKGHSGNYFVCVLPVEHELNLKKAAKVFGEKSLEMIPVAQINAVTGYIRGGCSPIGMKKNYRTVFDSSAQAQETMVVSGGKIGFQIEAKPDDLLRACGGVYADVLA